MLRNVPNQFDIEICVKSNDLIMERVEENYNLRRDSKFEKFDTFSRLTWNSLRINLPNFGLYTVRRIVYCGHFPREDMCVD